MSSAAKSVASPICCCYGENRVRTATAREGISSNKLSCKQVMGFATRNASSAINGEVLGANVQELSLGLKMLESVP